MKNYWLRKQDMLIILSYKQKIIELLYPPVFLVIVVILILSTIGCSSPTNKESQTAIQPTETNYLTEASLPNKADSAATHPPQQSTPSPISTTISNKNATVPATTIVTRLPTPRSETVDLIVTPPSTVVIDATFADGEVDRWPLERYSLNPDEQITGILTLEDGILSDGTPFRIYEFAGTPGQYVMLSLSSQEFDTFLALVDPAGYIIASNDDANLKEGTDSFLSLPIPTEGIYQVWVNSYTGAEGKFTLSLEFDELIQQNTTLHINEVTRGWLISSDLLNKEGILADYWTIKMLDKPLAIWLTSSEFDPFLRVLTPSGDVLIENDDLNFIAGDLNSRVVLVPSDRIPADTEITLEVSTRSHPVGGIYQLQAIPLPLAYDTEANVKIQAVIVKGEGGFGGSELTKEQIQSAVDYADSLWQTCAINIELVGNDIQVIEANGFESQIHVGEQEWTQDETFLQTHPTHALYEERLITTYFVKDIDGGERDGVAYPSTRFPASRSGLIIISDNGLSSPDNVNIFAHEIGHILGLEHPDPISGNDGDPWSDTPENLMWAQTPGSQLTPLQCAVARGERHYLHTRNDETLVPPIFQREDRVLVSGEFVIDALTTNDTLTPEGQYLDVYYFYGKEGDQITIELISDDFDAYLLVEGPEGERLGEDDDGGAGLNAKLTLILPTSGDYSIGISSIEPAVGQYRLSFSSAH